MWNHKEINFVDCSSNGEVTSIVYLKNHIFSGHSDGTLKVALSKFPTRSLSKPFFAVSDKLFDRCGREVKTSFALCTRPRNTRKQSPVCLSCTRRRSSTVDHWTGQLEYVSCRSLQEVASHTNRIGWTKFHGPVWCRCGSSEMASSGAWRSMTRETRCRTLPSPTPWPASCRKAQALR